LFDLGRKEDVSDALLGKVLVPVVDQLFREVISFVDADNELLVGAHFLDVLV